MTKQYLITSLIASIFMFTGFAVSNAQTSGVVTYSCPLIKSFMKIGWKNDVTEVTKLQLFLKNTEKSNLLITGIFDTDTESAVKAFQKKYMSDILGPWNSTRATGVVYITTVKKINQIACNQPLVLNADEISQIVNYNKNVVSGETQNISSPVVSNDGIDVVIVSTTSDDVESSGKISIFSKIWNFISNLF